MNRRTLLKCCAGLAVVACKAPIAAEGAVAYSRDVYEDALASGEAFLLDFSATW